MHISVASNMETTNCFRYTINKQTNRIGNTFVIQQFLGYTGDRQLWLLVDPVLHDVLINVACLWLQSVV